jgi:hypothetical protein
VKHLALPWPGLLWAGAGIGYLGTEGGAGPFIQVVEVWTVALSSTLAGLVGAYILEEGQVLYNLAELFSPGCST